jgi:hypothetical protein
MSIKIKSSFSFVQFNCFFTIRCFKNSASRKYWLRFYLKVYWFDCPRPLIFTEKSSEVKHFIFNCDVYITYQRKFPEVSYLIQPQNKTFPCPNYFSFSSLFIKPKAGLEMANPSPVPPNLRVIEQSSWIKDWNTFLDFPVLFHAAIHRKKFKDSDSRLRKLFHLSTSNRTNPVVVNFNAFPIKFTKICFKRTHQQNKIRTDSYYLESNLVPFNSAWYLNISTTYVQVQNKVDFNI